MKKQKFLSNLIIEGVVIVLSILLAFAIDAWWGDRVERAEEERVLAQFKSELELYDSLLGEADELTNSVVESTDYLLECVHTNADCDVESVSSAIRKLNYAYQFAAATATYDLLAGSGNLGLISSPKLRQAMSDLAAFISLVSRFEDDESAFLNTRLNPFLTDHVDLVAVLSASGSSSYPSSRHEWSFDELRTERKFSNLLVERRRHAKLVQNFRSKVGAAVVDAKIVLR